jgi:hypothetical protein
MTCPENIKKRARILFYNGFGFQSPGEGAGDNVFVICKCGDNVISEEKLEIVKQTSGVSSLKIHDWLGRDFITIHWSEYCKIPQVLNCMLFQGIPFTTNTKLSVYFKSGKHYSKEVEELKAIKQREKELLQSPSIINMITIFPDAMFKSWNYSTKKGKDFCKLIREKKGKKPQCEKTAKGNYFNWDIFQDYDPITLADLKDSVKILEITIPPEKPIENTLNKFREELCMICMEKEPESMVLPCEHSVVCRDCSLKLRDTNNKNKCIKCRVEITHILE